MSLTGKQYEINVKSENKKTTQMSQQDKQHQEKKTHSNKHDALLLVMMSNERRRLGNMIFVFLEFSFKFLWTDDQSDRNSVKLKCLKLTDLK